MRISWIEDELLAASSVPLSADDIRSLHQQGIRTILSLTERPILDFKGIDQALFDGLDISYFHSPIPDQQPPTDDQAHDILRIIDTAREQQRPMLVHCHAGMGRTGTILHLFYLAKGHSFEAAKNLVYKRRPQSTLLSDEQTQFLQRFTNTSDWAHQEKFIPDEVVEALLHLMEHFIERQQIVVRIMVLLRPELIRRYGIDKLLGIDIEPNLRALQIAQDKLEDFRMIFDGVWKDEWRWRLHGIGCQLTNIHTGEPFNWDSVHPYDLEYFWQHLDWRIRHEPTDLSIQTYLKWKQNHKLEPVKKALLGDDGKLRLFSEDPVMSYLKNRHFLIEQEIEGYIVIVPAHWPMYPTQQQS